MLDIKYYVLIDAIERHGSLQAAAAAIGLTQPAATHRVREMERRLAVSLFERRGRRTTLTAAGRRLLEAGREAVPILASAEADALLLARSDTQALKWGVDAHDIVSRILVESHRYEVKNLELYRFPTHTLASALFEKQIDFALMSDPPVQSGISNIFLFEDELRAVVPASHPLANRESVSAEEIAQEPFLTFSAAREPGYEFDLFFNPSGQAPVSIQTVESVSTILDAIALSQRGVSILSSWIIAAGHRRELAVKPLKGVTIPVRWYLSCRESGLVNENLEELKDIFQNISRQ
nr:HTH-type transcriptional activator CmpR [Virgibacillus halodenitrificans]